MNLKRKGRALVRRIGKRLAREEPVPPSMDDIRRAPWFAAQGDRTYRLNYELDENSVVLDLGGHRGDWTSDIFSMYCCTVHVFETVDTYANNIATRFAKNPKIHVHQVGLSGKDEIQKIWISEERSSQFQKSGEQKEMRLVAAADFLASINVQHIDLVKINIEGGEFDLLEHLVTTGFVKNIANIQVQFHEFVPDAEKRMVALQERLSVTHSLTYQFPFVWENWKIR